jgi:hypothetical protein
VCLCACRVALCVGCEGWHAPGEQLQGWRGLCGAARWWCGKECLSRGSTVPGLAGSEVRRVWATHTTARTAARHTWRCGMRAHPMNTPCRLLRVALRVLPPQPAVCGCHGLAGGLARARAAAVVVAAALLAGAVVVEGGRDGGRVWGITSLRRGGWLR